MEQFVFQARTKLQLKSWYAGKVRKNQMGFSSFETFETWYENQTKECHYCQIEETLVQEIVMRGLLTSSRFPKKGLKARWRNRWKWLEVDRKKPKMNYTPANCVLACYFCNNDKSDVFNETQYQEFKENRAGFLLGLLR